MERSKGARNGLPLRGRRVILASHLVFTGYGHWLSNDPRGSGSEEIRKDDLKSLGEIHLGRKRVQPPRDEIKNFYRAAEPLLEHEVKWFDENMRQAIAEAVGSAAKRLGYTLYALAICSNHAHAVVRSHRDRADSIWMNLANSAREALCQAALVSADHPVWSNRPYKVFKYTRDELSDAIKYVQDNPMKEGLPRQHWDFVRSYPG
jgi:REP element-mobilizing transposase RayT